MRCVPVLVPIALCLALFPASAQNIARLLPADERDRLVELVDAWFSGPSEPEPERPKPETLDALEKEFYRSPSLFTLLDYGLLLEAGRPRARERYPRKPDVWSEPRFTAMRRQLERYTLTRPLPPDSLPLREWWPDAPPTEPIVLPTSKRQAAYLPPTAPSLFKSDVDVFALSAVPRMTRLRNRLESPRDGIRYETPFDPPVRFPSTALLLANLGPLVEMFKLEGAGTLEITFTEQQLTQGAIDEWSSVVDTGSATLVVAGGRWPVYAITHGGVIRGRLTRVVSRGTECGGSGEYNAVVTFDRPLPKSTYAILRTTSAINPAKARITAVRPMTFFARPGYDAGLWYADLDGDGGQDVAMTIGGETWKGDYFTSGIYGNVNGRWKELLRSSRPSGCT
jgi:hypothetical protein